MQLYSVPEISPGQFRDQTFKTWTVSKWGAFCLTLAVSAGLIYFATRGGYNSPAVYLPPFLLYWTGGVIGCVSMLLLVYARAALRSSNWLLKSNPERLLIKIRSHLNDHFPQEDPVIISLANSEVTWIRKYRETMSAPDTELTGTAEHLSRWTYLELQLADTVDISKLQDALQAERNRQAPTIGRTRTKHKHYPVKITDSGILRLEWNGIRPGIDKALRILGTRFTRQPEQRVRATHWNDLEGKALDDRIVDLVEKGHTTAAVALVRMKYGYDLSRAKAFVDELSQ